MQHALIKKWTKLIFSSLSDQALYSLSTFILNILLARWMTPSEYGAFAFGFSIFLLYAGFQSALILEPMTVLGPSKYKNDLDYFVKYLLQLHWILTLPISGLGLLISLLFYHSFPQIADGVIGASLSTPFILLYWFARRMCYLYNRPQLAAIGSILYISITMTGLFFFYSFFPITIVRVFLLMAVASIFASIFVWSILKKRKINKEQSSLNTKKIWPALWQYGKWALGTTCVYWAAYSITIPMIGLLLGLEQSGVFRALQNLTLPLLQVGTALGTLITPWLSSQILNTPKSIIIKRTNLLIVSLTSISIFYLFCLVIFSNKLLGFLYDKPEYFKHSWLVIYLGIYGVMEQLSNGLSIILRSIQRPNSIFWAQLLGATISLALKFILIIIYGINGAALGLIITNVIVAITLFYHYFQHVISKNVLYLEVT